MPEINGFGMVTVTMVVKHSIVLFKPSASRRPIDQYVSTGTCMLERNISISSVAAVLPVSLRLLA